MRITVLATSGGLVSRTAADFHAVVDAAIALDKIGDSAGRVDNI